MKHVWIVTTGEYSDLNVDSVWATRREATECARGWAERRVSVGIEKWPIGGGRRLKSQDFPPASYPEDWHTKTYVDTGSVRYVQLHTSDMQPGHAVLFNQQDVTWADHEVNDLGEAKVNVWKPVTWESGAALDDENRQCDD